MQDKPLIGCVPLVDYARESLWMLPGYFDAVTEAGGVPVMLPLTSDPAAISQLVGTLDGLVVTGGQDVDPAAYDVKTIERARKARVRKEIHRERK